MAPSGDLREDRGLLQHRPKTFVMTGNCGTRFRSLREKWLSQAQQTVTNRGPE